MEILKIAHPFIPFMTEILWKEFTNARQGLLILQPWPETNSEIIDLSAAQEMNWIVQVIDGIRSRRAEFNVPPGSLLPLHVYEATPEIQARLTRHEAILMRLGRVETISVFPEKPGLMKEAVQFLAGNTPLILPLGGSIDVPTEIKRLEDEFKKVTSEISSCHNRLSNTDFMEKAKPEIIEEMQDRMEAFGARKAKIEEALLRLRS